MRRIRLHILLLQPLLRPHTLGIPRSPQFLLQLGHFQRIHRRQRLQMHHDLAVGFLEHRQFLVQSCNLAVDIADPLDAVAQVGGQTGPSHTTLVHRPELFGDLDGVDFFRTIVHIGVVSELHLSLSHITPNISPPLVRRLLSRVEHVHRIPRCTAGKPHILLIYVELGDLQQHLPLLLGLGLGKCERVEGDVIPKLLEQLGLRQSFGQRPAIDARHLEQRPALAKAQVDLVLRGFLILADGEHHSALV